MEQPVFQRVRPPVVVNGTAYNRIGYVPKSCTVILAVGHYEQIESAFSTTLEELSTYYGLKTAVKVRQALLDVGYGGYV